MLTILKTLWDAFWAAFKITLELLAFIAGTITAFLLLAGFVYVAVMGVLLWLVQ